VKKLLGLEEGFLVLLSFFLFRGLGIDWWWFAVWFFAPDLSMLGYLAGPKAGAILYNFFHHKALAVAVYAAGTWIGQPALACAGLILLAHSSFDRVLGYGLKYADSFTHTHLGRIGNAPNTP